MARVLSAGTGADVMVTTTSGLTFGKGICWRSQERRLDDPLVRLREARGRFIDDRERLLERVELRVSREKRLWKRSR